MAEILTIAQLGDPILRQTAQPVSETHDENLQRLIDSLIITAAWANGVGIAAPQVSHAYRLFIVASRPSPRYPHAPEMEPTAMLNPKIIAASEKKEKGWEGCLSVLGWRGLVPRHREIEVEFLDRHGNLQRRILTDFIARIFQHELDHLDGIVFLDRLESASDRYTEEAYQKMIS